MIFGRNQVTNVLVITHKSAQTDGGILYSISQHLLNICAHKS